MNKIISSTADLELSILREVCYTFGSPTKMVCSNCGEKNIHAEMMSLNDGYCKAHYMCKCGEEFYFEGTSKYPHEMSSV